MKPSTVQTNPSLSDLLRDPSRLPIDSQPVRLEGRLLGRRSVDNWLNQDVFLDTPTGMIKLHVTSQLGPIGNILFDKMHLQPLMTRPVSVTGWFRRGATPWIDVDTIKTQSGRSIRSGHPIWSTVVAFAVALWGAFIIGQGTF